MVLTLANKLTVFRFFLVPVFVWTVLCYSPDKDYLRFIALGIFLFAVLLDVFDGYVARKYHQETKIGSILDPLADKILLISTYFCLYKVGVHFEIIQFPIWLVIAVIGRDVILLLGAAIIRLVNGDITVNPTGWGKATVFFETIAAFGILLQWQKSSIIWFVVLVMVIISGCDYIFKGIKELNNGVKAA